MRDIYLVQRLAAQRWSSGKKGFDRLFALEYMGSAEFEFGLVQESLKRLRAAPHGPSIDGQKIELMDVRRDVYFVSDVEKISDRIAIFERWLELGLPCKEPTYFLPNFEGTANAWEAETIAWWSLDIDLFWTLDPHVAELLVTAVWRP